ncbi:MAG TPA: hypothetical protein DD619_01620, partial [Alphaproteobacteria bacterium]|nr:hypothetical protein [Alphaproteobacteria bacterium]
GVLAIIGVLSVGGIAGYSQAMEKWKVNKLVSEYSLLIHGLIEHYDALLKQTDTSYIAQYVLDLGLVPETWKLFNERYLSDSSNNLVQIFINASSTPYHMTVDFNLGGMTDDDNGNHISSAFSEKTCRKIFSNLVYPLHNLIRYTMVYRSTNGKNDTFTVYTGDAYCHKENSKCLSSITVAEIHNICKTCDKTTQRCNVTIGF